MSLRARTPRASPRVAAALFFSAVLFGLSPDPRAGASSTIDAAGFALISAERSPHCPYALLGPRGHIEACGFRVSISNPPRGLEARCSLESYDRFGGRLRDRVDLSFAEKSGAAQSEPIEVVDDPLSKALGEPRLFALAGDRVVVKASTAGGVKPPPLVLESAAVSSSGAPLSTEKLNLKVTVMRDGSEGRLAVGKDPVDARRAMWFQLRVVDEVLSQCGLRVPDIVDVPFSVADPPRGSLLVIGDPWGLASNGGLVRLKIEDEQLGPWRLPKNLTPAQTARALASRLSKRGYRAEVHVHPRVPSGNEGPADIAVYSRTRDALTVTAWPNAPVSTDEAQPIDLGRVTPCDGLDPYDYGREHIGTVEERALIELMGGQREKGRIEIIAVSRFACREKLGEAFLGSVNPNLGDTVIIDARAALRARHAFVLAHELGHVLLQSLGHPQDPPESSQTNLMSWDTSAGLDGPRRLTRRQCDSIRRKAAFFDGSKFYGEVQSNRKTK